MSQIPLFSASEHAPKDDFGKDLERNLDVFAAKIREILNKGILFADNFDAYITTITTSATPGTQTAIAHGLKRTPSGCIVLEKNKAAHIYKGASGKDATTYYIASDVASVTVTLMIF